jgi:Protein of unknown function (DUF4239)
MQIFGFMPVALQAITVVLVFGGLSVTGLFIVRRTVSLEILRGDHDVAGYTFGVVGAFYGVVLAFVIVAVWQRFERADEQAHAEALALTNLFQLSRGLQPPVRSEMTAAIRAYALNVSQNEWREMAEARYRRNLGPERRLWQVLLSYRPQDVLEQDILDKSIDQLALLSDARRLRYVYYSEPLPSVVWIVIWVGCVITIGFSYFFGTNVFRSQAIMCGTFAALIGLTILAITELSRPYQGALVVSDRPFRSLVEMIPPPAQHAPFAAPAPSP